jgi:formyltetrahydrofolate-dependent phosphoribosylglycinamide formyltransferase
MIHNKVKCGAAKRADKLGIPHSFIESTEEINMIRLIQAWNVDLVILAGWMRIVTKDFIDAFRGRIINVHPSLLPKYKGLHAVEQAMDAGETETGATVHYVTEELDGGPIIIQSKVPILHNDDVKSLTKAIQRREYAILPEAIKHVKHELQKQDSGYMLQDDIYRWDGRLKRKDLDEQTMQQQ